MGKEKPERFVPIRSASKAGFTQGLLSENIGNNYTYMHFLKHESYDFYVHCPIVLQGSLMGSYNKVLFVLAFQTVLVRAVATGTAPAILNKSAIAEVGQMAAVVHQDLVSVA